jgi:hypothetical protein
VIAGNYDSNDPVIWIRGDGSARVYDRLSGRWLPATGSPTMGGAR